MFGKNIFKTILGVAFIFFCAPLLRAEIHTFDIGQFEKLKINGNISVVYRCLPDSTGFAQYEAPAGKDNYFLFTVKNDGTLRIQLSETQWSKTDLPVVHVYSDFLSSVESSSDLSVSIENVAPCASFHVNQIGNGSITVDGLKCNNVSASITTGNGSIYLTGQCVNAKYKMVGAGLISADMLRADNVKCSILGTGTIGCWPVDNLKVSGIGSTKIYYKGEPEIKKSGGGKLFELPEQSPEEVLVPFRPDNAPAAQEITPSPNNNAVGSSEDNDDNDDDDDEDDEDDDEDDDDTPVVVEIDESEMTIVTADD